MVMMFRLCMIAAVLGMVAISTSIPSVAAVPNTTLYFFPSECSTDTALAARTCCPSYSSSICGSAYGRGECTSPLFSSNPTTGICDGEVALSIFWFTDYFDQSCVCSGNYWGVACELCAPGWGGDDCMTALPLRVRRDIDTLSATELAQVVEAFELMHSTPHPYWPEQSMWQWMVSLHQWSTGAYTNDGINLKPIDYSHDGPALLVWHRAYQYYMEYYMMDALNDPTFAIPYWNYSKLATELDGLPPRSAAAAELYRSNVALNLVGGTGDQNSLDAPINCSANAYCRCTLTQGPFADWKCIGLWGQNLWTVLNDEAQEMPLQRGFGCVDNSWLPSNAELESINHKWSHWEFANLFQSAHGAVHRWLGYTMAFGSPPSDPIFFMYHAYVDLQMEKWIRLAMQRGVFTLDNILPKYYMNVGHRLMQCSTPIFPLISNRRMLVPTYALGYTYDYLSLDASAAEPAVTTGHTLAEVAAPTNLTAYRLSTALATNHSSALSSNATMSLSMQMAYYAPWHPTLASSPLTLDVEAVLTRGGAGAGAGAGARTRHHRHRHQRAATTTTAAATTTTTSRHQRLHKLRSSRSRSHPAQP